MDYFKELNSIYMELGALLQDMKVDIQEKKNYEDLYWESQMTIAMEIDREKGNV